MGVGTEFYRALRSMFGSAGVRSSAGATSGITRTRIFTGACEINAIWVAADRIANAPTTLAFWSIDDSSTSASGSAGAAILGQFIGPGTGVGYENYDREFVRPIPLDTGLTFNYTATGTGTALRYSIWYSPRQT